MITFGVIWAFCFGLWILIEQRISPYTWFLYHTSTNKIAFMTARGTLVVPVALLLTAFTYWG